MTNSKRNLRTEKQASPLSDLGSDLAKFNLETERYYLITRSMSTSYFINMVRAMVEDSTSENPSPDKKYLILDILANSKDMIATLLSTPFTESSQFLRKRWSQSSLEPIFEGGWDNSTYLLPCPFFQ